MIKSTIAADAFRAGTDMRLWPKNMSEYKQQWRDGGNDYFSSLPAVAFRIYSGASVHLGESDALRDAIYLSVAIEAAGVRQIKGGDA